MRLTGLNAASASSDASSSQDDDRVQLLEPALWKQLGEAADFTAFSQIWLALQCGLIGNVANQTVGPEWQAAQSEAHALDIETIQSGFSRTEEIAPAIENLKGRVEALYVCQDPLVGSSIAEINPA